MMQETELRTARGFGASPKLTLETPRIVSTPGSSRLMRRDPLDRLLRRVDPLRVARSERERQCIENQIRRVETVLSGHDFMNGARDFQLALARLRHAHFVDRQRHDGGPVLLHNGTTLSMRLRPFSMLMEFTIARPGMCSSAFSITLASVESTTIGDSTDIEGA